jgi:hypothetical protein
VLKAESLKVGSRTSCCGNANRHMKKNASIASHHNQICPAQYLPIQSADEATKI